MRKIFGFALVLAVNCSVAQPHVKLSGVLADSTDRKGISYATISLVNTSGENRRLNAITDNYGQYSLNEVTTGNYVLTAYCIGYKSYQSEIFYFDGKTQKMDTIFVEKSSVDLNAVTITAAKPLFEMETDKMVYHVGKDLNMVGLSATEALMKLPFISVDGQDKIQLKGSSNFVVLLNGKSTSIVAKNPSEALRAFPAALIKRIEVITEPSAKYDAEGIGGIINIITYKKVVGFSGNAYLSHSTKGINSGGTSLNVKRGKLGFSSNIGANQYRYSNQTTSDYLRINKTPGYQSTMSQHSTDNWKGHWYWGYAELAYEFDSFNTLSMYASQNGAANYGETYQTTDITDMNTQITESIKTDINIDNKSPKIDFGLDFRKKYSDSEDRELSFSAFKQTQKDISSYQSIQDFKLLTDRDIYNINKSQIMEHTFMLDYREPINNNVTLETGTKLILRHASSNYRMLERSGFTEYYSENPDRTDKLFYNQNVGSLYTTLAFPWKSYKIKFGIRVEQTWIHASFNGDSLPLVLDYLNLIPTAGIYRTIKKGQMLKLNYSKRIQRPWLYYLNPYIDDQNPQSISYGNPFLKPEKTHSVTLSWNYFFKQKYLDISLSNSNTDDVTTSYMFVDTNDISRTSYFNMAQSYILGLNICFSTTFFNKLKVWVNAGSSFVKLTHKLDNSRNRDGFNHNVNGSFTWSSKHGFSTTLGGWVYQGAPTLQTVRRLSYNYDFSVRKTFFKKKLAFVLVANNFLEKKQTLKTIGEDPTFYSESSWTNNLYRFYGFNLSYNFGMVNKVQKANEIDFIRPLMRDRDYDGVPDEDDICPDQPGQIQFGGCSSALMTTNGLKNVYSSLVNDVASIAKTLDSLKEEIRAVKSELEKQQMGQSAFELNPKKTELPPVGDVFKAGNTHKAEYPNLVKEDLRSYYVIVISTKQFALAKESSDKWARKHSKVLILAQSNGFYRVGIFASNSKSEALKVLDFVKRSGATNAWLSFE